MRRTIMLGVLLVLAIPACTQDAETGEEPVASTTVPIAPPTTTPPTTTPPTTTSPTTSSTTFATTTTTTPAEPYGIIQAWAEDRLSDEPWDFVDLYAFNGTYRDLTCGFEANGRHAIQRMFNLHLISADYTVVHPATITNNESQVVVQWRWTGTYDGEPFEVEPTTTFEFENGLILASTDSYDRTDVPKQWLDDCDLYPRP